jgi:hypothetical protein
VDVGLGVVRFRYEERGPTGAVIDREEGLVPAASFAVEHDVSPWVLGAAAEVAAGDVTYDGRTSSANVALHGLPVRTTSAARLIRVGAELGRWIDPGRRLGLSAGAGWRSWSRRIAPAATVTASGSAVSVAGLDERYRWAELQVGGRWVFLRAGRWEWRLEARAELPVAPSVAVDAPAGPVELHPAARLGWRVSLPLLVTFRARGYAAVEPYAAAARLGASGVDATSRLFEPASDARTLGLRVRLGARL